MYQLCISSQDNCKPVTVDSCQVSSRGHKFEANIQRPSEPYEISLDMGFNSDFIAKFSGHPDKISLYMYIPGPQLWG